MARNLPWLKKGTASVVGPSRARAPKRQRIASPDVDEEVDHSGMSTPRKKARSEQARTPSTSPPPLLSPEEFMQEGLDKDDIFIMVEDQFQSIAQSFTEHLHKAEYRRLTEQAKKQKASTIRDISRPTDAFTVMRTETKKMKESRELAGKQKAGLRELTSAGRRATQNGADDDSDLEKEKADDPWVGTSLHGFMTSPRKSQQALVGLHGVKSKTRAAAGFAKAELKSPVVRRGLMDLDISKETSNRNAQEEPIRIDDTETTSGDEDDLDAMPSAPSQATKTSTNSFIFSKKSVSTNTPIPKGTGQTEDQGIPLRNQDSSAAFVERVKPNSKPKPVRNFAWYDDFDGLASDPKTKNGCSEDLLPRKVGSKPGSHGMHEKPPQVTVVPTFLV